jgi:hypothetical protein
LVDYQQLLKKLDFFLVGITVLRGITFVITPPTVSIPIVNGLTTNKTKSPERTAAP